MHYFNEKKIKEVGKPFIVSKIVTMLDEAFDKELDKSLKPYVKAIAEGNAGKFKVEVDERDFGGTKTTYSCSVSVGLINYEIISDDSDRGSYVGTDKEELKKDVKNYVKEVLRYANVNSLLKKISKSKKESLMADVRRKQKILTEAKLALREALRG